MEDQLLSIFRVGFNYIYTIVVCSTLIYYIYMAKKNVFCFCFFSSGKFYLYYNLASQGFWAVGEKLGSEVVRLENQGDRFCPYYLKSLWRYADGDLNALVYDTSLRTVCMNDVCSVARCGHQVCLVFLYPKKPLPIF